MGILGTSVVSFHKDNIFMETCHVSTFLNKKIVLCRKCLLETILMSGKKIYMYNTLDLRFNAVVGIPDQQPIHRVLHRLEKYWKITQKP